MYMEYLEHYFKFCHTFDLEPTFEGLKDLRQLILKHKPSQKENRNLSHIHVIIEALKNS